MNVIAKAHPNGHPIRLIQDHDLFVVEETDSEGYWEYTDDGCGDEFSTLAEAQTHFDARVREF